MSGDPTIWSKVMSLRALPEISNYISSLKHRYMRFSVGTYDTDDIEHEAILALYIAMGYWNPEKGRAEQISKLIMRQRVHVFCSRQNHCLNIPEGSSKFFGEVDQGLRCSNFDNFKADPIDYEAIIDMREMVEADLLVSTYVYGGLRYREVAKIFGVSDSYVCRRVQAVRKTYDDACNNCGVLNLHADQFIEDPVVEPKSPAKPKSPVGDSYNWRKKQVFNQVGPSFASCTSNKENKWST